MFVVGGTGVAERTAGSPAIGFEDTVAEAGCIASPGGVAWVGRDFGVSEVS